MTLVGSWPFFGDTVVIIGETPSRSEPPHKLPDTLRLPRNYYVTVDTNHYSVDPGYVGRLVTVRTTLNHVIVTGPGGEPIATHQRLWAKGRTITDPAHQAAAKVLRHQRAAVTTPKPSFDVDVADLSVYDRITSTPVKRTTA